MLRLSEALHRELQRDGVTVTALCPGLSTNTGFATAAQQKITPVLKRLMMQPAPVVRDGIRALHAGRISVCARLGQRGPRDPHVGDATLAAPGLSLSRHELMSHNAESSAAVSARAIRTIRVVAFAASLNGWGK